MANKTLFQSLKGKLIPETNSINHEWAPAYDLGPEHTLAQYVITGCLNGSFYASGQEQLQTIVRLGDAVNPLFVAKLAIYAREKGYMKDAPALLCAVLSRKSPELLKRIFTRVIDNGKMLRNFVQIMRSGAAGRKSLGTVPKNLILEWLNSRTEQTIFHASVGADPSLADILKMVHPKPATKIREAFYGYLIGRQHKFDDLPKIVQEFELYKQGQLRKVPDVPFQMLTALALGTKEWKDIALHGSWQMLRMNLNTFVRHGVFSDQKMIEFVASRLKDEESIRKARVFPYQLMTAFQASAKEVPTKLRTALQDAMEIAIDNVPSIAGKVFVFPDVSGSMRSPVTGRRKGSTTSVRCVDVAALVTASILRKNRDAEVLPFEESVVEIDLNSKDSVMTNAKKLASIGGGGTNCSAPLSKLNKRGARGDLVIFISDNESWVDAGAGRGTKTMREWNAFRQRNPGSRLVCIDIQPNATTQVAEQEHVLNIGGFSDQVFSVVSEFAAGKLSAKHWIDVIQSVEL